MAYISFTSRWVEPILDGRKTQTLRRTIPATVAVADTIHALCDHRYGPFADLAVLSVDRIALVDLTRADARREGLRSLPHLLDALDALYPGVPNLMRLKFQLA